MIVDADLDSIPEFKKNVVIVFDEMKIKSDLVCRKSTRQLIGFTELGEINYEIRDFESRVNGDDVRKDFSTHVLVYMVRRISSNRSYPFGSFASTGFTSTQLFPATMEALRVLERIGFYVRILTSDGTSPNRKLFDMLTNDDPGNIYWTCNLYDNDRKLYFMSDVPHLLKAIRNCLENSG